jgi:hypothetical protein
MSLIKGENNRSPFNPPNEPIGCISQKAKGPRPNITVCVNSTEKLRTQIEDWFTGP